MPAIQYAMSMAEKMDEIANRHSGEFKERVDGLSKEVNLVNKSIAGMRDSSTPSMELLSNTAAGKLSALQQGIARSSKFNNTQKMNISKKDFDGISGHFKRTMVHVPEDGGQGSFRGPAGMHAHEHGDRMSVHVDKHDPTKTAVGMFAHGLTEGMPAGVDAVRSKMAPSGMSDTEYRNLLKELNLGKQL